MNSVRLGLRLAIRFIDVVLFLRQALTRGGTDPCGRWPVRSGGSEEADHHSNSPSYTANSRGSEGGEATHSCEENVMVGFPVTILGWLFRIRSLGWALNEPCRSCTMWSIVTDRMPRLTVSSSATRASSKSAAFRIAASRVVTCCVAAYESYDSANVIRTAEYSKETS